MLESAYPIPAFTDNYIWALTNTASGQVCVVDPGDAEPVLKFLAHRNLQLSHILITHHHPDHTGGLLQLAEKFSPQVFGPDNPSIQGITDVLHEGDIARVWELQFRIIEVPGHTLDHIAYYSDDESPPALFCGDTLFAAGCGRLFEGSPSQMHQSLDKLKSLPDDTLVYCTHEYTLANLKFASAADPDNTDLQARCQREQQKRDEDTPTLPSTIALERATNPFLRSDDSNILANLQSRGLNSSDPVDSFAALRQWKDNF